MYLQWHRSLFIVAVSLFVVITGQNLSRQCGLPQNINQFPEFAQEELRSVWKNYVPGTQCDKELLVTDDILAVLDMFETEIPGTPPIPSAPSAINENINTPALLSVQPPPSSQTITNTAENFSRGTVPSAVPQTSATGFSPTSVETPQTTSSENDDDYADFGPPITEATRNIPSTTRRPKTFHRQNSVENNEEIYNEIPFHEMRNYLPFLEGADDRTVRVFHDVLNDANVPSEGRREEMIHVLAVSYLDAQQLEQFNAWSTSRRKKLRAREEQLKGLSYGAQDALKKLVLSDDASRDNLVSNFPANIRRELRRFALRRKAARS